MWAADIVDQTNNLSTRSKTPLTNTLAYPKEQLIATYSILYYFL